MCSLIRRTRAPHMESQYKLQHQLQRVSAAKLRSPRGRALGAWRSLAITLACSPRHHARIVLCIALIFFFSFFLPLPPCSASPSAKTASSSASSSSSCKNETASSPPSHIMHTSASLNSSFVIVPSPFVSSIPNTISAASLGAPWDTKNSSTSDLSTVPLPSLSIPSNACFRTSGSQTSPSCLAVSLVHTFLALSPSLAVGAGQSTPSSVHTDSCWPPPSPSSSCWPSSSCLPSFRRMALSP